MNDDDKGTVKWTIMIVVLLSLVFSIPVYQYHHVWSEQGKISWVGPKTFADSNGNEKFVFPFAVTVPIHGIFNFTATGYIGLCGNASNQNPPLINGTIVGLVKLQCGGFDLVVDP